MINLCGYVICLNVCFVKAIWLHCGVATILVEICHSCRRCYRVFSYWSVHCCTNILYDLFDFRHKIAVASLALFSQLDYKVTPNQILIVLKSIGFNGVVDLGWICEIIFFLGGGCRRIFICSSRVAFMVLYIQL